jgi:N-acetylglucosaminyldiphosphoundecaprenol N-acetyl-beta-D-mannosaminyltransferase
MANRSAPIPAPPANDPLTGRPLVFLLGLPFHAVTMDETVAICSQLIRDRKSAYAITANVDFVAQAYTNPQLRSILQHADLAVCDGMPLVWLSRWFKPVLPERVAGSDLVHRLFEQADHNQWRVFFLGSDDQTLSRAKSVLDQRYPRMIVADQFSPPYAPVDHWPNDEILRRIRQAQPDILCVAVGCPKQEYWIRRYAQQAGVPLSIGIGASLDFIAGSQTRAPRWVQRIGMEWLWRMGTDPMRLTKRYAKDFWYLFYLTWIQWRLTRKSSNGSTSAQGSAPGQPAANVVQWPESIERATLSGIPVPQVAGPSVVVDMSAVRFMDSSGIGLLIQVARDARRNNAQLVLRNPAPAIRQLLDKLKLSELFQIEQAGRRPRVLLSAGMIQAGESGVGRYVVELANRMAADPSIDLLVAGLASDRHLFPAITAAAWCEIPAHAARGWRNLLWHQTALRRLLRQTGATIYHSPSYRRVMAVCPTHQTVTVHDCAPFRLRDKYGLLRGLYGRRIVPWLVRRCQQVLTVSAFTKADLQQYFRLPSERVAVIHNGLDRQRFLPHSPADDAAFRAAKQLPDRYFLYISRLEHPGKNHIRMIQAYEQFRDAGGEPVALILGGADWHGAAVIHERVAASHWRAAIHLPGFIDDRDLPHWYGCAFALVFPSLMEGFGLPVAEAMACGVPVACSDRGSLPEVAGGAALLFNPESVDEMAAVLQQLTALTPAARAERQQRGRANAARFDWATAARLTAATYHNPSLNPE